TWRRGCEGVAKGAQPHPRPLAVQQDPGFLVGCRQALEIFRRELCQIQEVGRMPLERVLRLLLQASSQLAGSRWTLEDVAVIAWRPSPHPVPGRTSIAQQGPERVRGVGKRNVN